MPSSSSQRRPRGRAGQAAVEFGLVSLTLITLIVGTLDLGRAVFQRQILANAAREGARYGAITFNARALAPAAFEDAIAATAARRAPTLGLAGKNFRAAGNGSVTCESWDSPLYLGVASVTTPLTGGYGGWTTIPCSAAAPGDRLTVCVAYQFQALAATILGQGALPLRDCAAVTVQ